MYSVTDEYYHSLAISGTGNHKSLENVIIKNEMPKDAGGIWVLKFESKDYVSSRKNFKLNPMTIDGAHVLEFGKVAPTHYRLVYNNPLCGLTAIALCITRFFVN